MHSHWKSDPITVLYVNNIESVIGIHTQNVLLSLGLLLFE